MRSVKRFLVLTVKPLEWSRQLNKMQQISPAAYLASLDETQRTELLSSLSPEALAELKWDWKFWARPNQLAPEGDWNT